MSVSTPKKKKWWANICRTDVKDRMDLSDLWTKDPSQFTSQQTAAWNASDAYLSLLVDDNATAAATDTALGNVFTAMDAI